MFSVSHAVLYLSSVVIFISVPAEMGRSASPVVFPVRISYSHELVSLLVSHQHVGDFTYRSLGIKGNGDLAAGLGLLGSASIVDDRLVVLILALQDCQLFMLFVHGQVS